MRTKIDLPDVPQSQDDQDIQAIREQITKLKSQRDKLDESIAKKKRSVSTLNRKLEEANAELQRVTDAQKEINRDIALLSERFDFVLPENFTEDVYDAAVWINPIGYNNFNCCLVLFTETSSMFGRKKLEREEHVFGTFENTTLEAVKQSKQYFRAQSYAAAIKQHICAKHRIVDNTALIHKGNEAIISSDSNDKDAFILEVIETLKS